MHGSGDSALTHAGTCIKVRNARFHVERGVRSGVKCSVVGGVQDFAPRVQGDIDPWPGI